MPQAQPLKAQPIVVKWSRFLWQKPLQPQELARKLKRMRSDENDAHILLELLKNTSAQTIVDDLDELDADDKALLDSFNKQQEDKEAKKGPTRDEILRKIQIQQQIIRDNQ